MADAAQAAKASGGALGGIKAFLQASTAGLPNWVWGVIIVGGGIAAFVVPKLFKSSSTAAASSGTDTGGAASGVTDGSGGQSGLDSGLNNPYSGGLDQGGGGLGGASAPDDSAAFAEILALLQAQGTHTTPPGSEPAEQEPPSPEPIKKEPPGPKPPVKKKEKGPPGPEPPIKEKEPPDEHKKKQHEREYTVEKGDTLSKIATKEYHNAGDWHKIYAANRSIIGPNPNEIKPGERLKIPA